MLKRSKLALKTALVSATLLASPFNAQAAEIKQIARSSKLGVELFGIGGNDWCKADAQLQLSRTDDSPLIGTEETLFPKISKIFETECPQMETAGIVVHNSTGALMREFRISREAGWSIAASVIPKTPQTTQNPQTTQTAPTENTGPAATAQSDTSSPPAAPAAPLPPQTAEPAASEEQSPSTSEIQPVKEEAVPLTADNALKLAARYSSEALNDDLVIDQLATLGGCDQYNKIRNNEFALRDWRKEVKPDVLRQVESASDLFEFSFKFRVNRKYDFDTAMLDIGSFIPRTREYEHSCHWARDFRQNAMGGRVYVNFEGLPDTFNSKIYLPNELGRSAVDRLEATNNEVRVTYRARLKNVGLETDWPKHYALRAEFVDVKIHTGEQFDYLLVHHDAAKFAAAREQHERALQKAEAEQKAHEQELQRLQVTRENEDAQRLYDQLSGEGTVPALLAALQHDGDTSFDNPYEIAANALTQGRKFPVRAFIQAGDRDSIGYRAQWPSRVYLTGAEIEEGKWYFVSGMADGQKIDNALFSMIAIDKVTKCDARICMSDEDIISFVQSRYPQWTGAKE